LQHGLLEQLEADLTRERELTAQVRHHLAAHHEVGPEGIAAFLRERLSCLEEYEVDLIFASMFTPSVEDQARYAPYLDPSGIPPEGEARLIRELASRNLRMALRMDGERISVPLPEVVVARYVHLLNLTAPLAEVLVREIPLHVPPGERNRVLALGRHPVWQEGRRADLLAAFLRVFARQGTYSWEKLRFLTDLARSFRPATPLDFARQLENLTDAYEAGDPSSFYHPQIEERYRDVPSVPRKYVPSPAQVLPLLREIRADLERILQESPA